MQPRTTLQDQFSSFAHLDENQFKRWQTDARLRKSMERCLLQDQTLDPCDRIWALYWYRFWQKKHPLAEAHLGAYLQESCYWLAQRLQQKTRRAGSTTQYSVADLFQIAVLGIRSTLESFDAKTSGNLEGFAKVALGFRLRATLRRRRLAGFCSDWGLLRKTSVKGLLEALALAGLTPQEVEQHRLLWMGFKAIYIDLQQEQGGALPEPSPDQWQAIADFYNRQRSGQLLQAAIAIDAAQAERQLRRTSQSLRQYLYPSVESLNAQPFESPEGDRIEKQDLLLASDQSSLLAGLIEADEARQRAEGHQQVRRLLLAKFESFDAETQQILCLTYHHDLPQKTICKQTGLSQPTVSRRINRAKHEMVEVILQQRQTVNNFPEPEQLKEVWQLLAECLRLYLAEADYCSSDR